MVVVVGQLPPPLTVVVVVGQPPPLTVVVVVGQLLQVIVRIKFIPVPIAGRGHINSASRGPKGGIDTPYTCVAGGYR